MNILDKFGRDRHDKRRNPSFQIWLYLHETEQNEEFCQLTQETKILKAFTEKISPISLNFKGSREKGLINFGEIRLPNEMVEEDDELLAQLGRAHSCEIKKKENYVYIVPLVIIDKIKREGFVTSHDEEFIGELNRWMKKNFKELLTKVRGNP